MALTLDVYTHIGLHDERRAIEKLPKLHSPDDKSRAVALKTGTNDRPVELAENGQEKLTPKLTPFLTPTAFSEHNGLAATGNERGNSQETDNTSNYQNSKRLGKESNCLATVGVGENEMGRGGLEPPTQGFSVPCSTN